MTGRNLITSTMELTTIFYAFGGGEDLPVVDGAQNSVLDVVEDI